MRCFVLPFAFLASFANAEDTLPALQPSDVFALQWADRPQLSPDGTRIVYERTFFDAQKDVRRSNLWLIDLAKRTRRPLTTGSTRDSQAEWSPDGTRVAYVALDGERPQIHVRWIDSGAIARITQLTESPQGLAWSPDGELIAFTMHVPAKTEPLAKLPDAPKDATWAEPAKYIDRLQYRFDGAGYLDPGYQQVFVVPAEGGTPRQLTRKERDHDGPPAWLPDGRALIVASNYADDADYDPLERDLYRIALVDGEATRLTTRDGPETQPQLSPDGRHVAYTGFVDRRQGYQNATLSVLNLASGASRELTSTLDTTIDDFRWDGNDALWIAYDARGRGTLGRVTLGGDVERIADDFGGTAMGRPYGGGSLSAARGRVAYTQGDALSAANVALVSRGGKPNRLTDLNAGLLPHRTLGEVDSFTTKSKADGREVESWLVYPPFFDRAKRYPLLLEIHGGPFANYGPRFAPETQLYAAAGYIVLYSNPRGSTSYGAEFANAIHHAYPSQDYDDLMSAVDAAIARGNVDESNLFVTGGSGGGVLTAWTVGHTDRFRAAVVAKPVINWTSFVLTADASAFFSQYWFPGLPWDEPEHYFKRSPLAYVGNVKTPTMVVSGESDYRTPISEAEQYYQALKLRRVDTALLRIPGASHSINARPSQMLTQVLNTIAWFERHRVKPSGD